MKRTSAHTDATEHAYDDNTGPRGSDATERAATMEAMLQSAQTPATNAASLYAQPKAVAPKEPGSGRRALKLSFPVFDDKELTNAVWACDAQPAAVAQEVERLPATGAVSPGASGQPPPAATEHGTDLHRPWCIYPVKKDHKG